MTASGRTDFDSFSKISIKCFATCSLPFICYSFKKEKLLLCCDRGKARLSKWCNLFLYEAILSFFPPFSILQPTQIFGIFRKNINDVVKPFLCHNLRVSVVSKKHKHIQLCRVKMKRSITTRKFATSSQLKHSFQSLRVCAFEQNGGCRGCYLMI